MASTGLEGPFVLTHDGITKAVTKVSPGAYALGTTGADGVFYIARVGRSDKCLKLRLHSYVGQYPEFKASYFASAEEAFLKECELFHNFSPPHNDIHPDRPDFSIRARTCPYCQALD